MLPQAHLSATSSSVAAALMLALPGYFLLRAWARSARNAALGREPDATHIDRARGEGVFEGHVTHAQAAEVAMRVEIDQEGTESESSGSYSWRWTETTRRVRFAPFYLTLADQSRIRVEPTTDAYLVDDLDQKIIVRDTFRTRIAELVPGERVWIAGALEDGHDPESRDGAYRTSGHGRILRAPRGRPLLVSSEPLGAKYLKRAQFHRGFAMAFALALGVSVAMVVPYVDRALGTTVEATVVGVSIRTNDDGDAVGYNTRAQGSFGSATGSLRSRLPVGTKVPVRTGVLSAQLGEEPTLNVMLALVAVVLATALAITYRVRAGRTLPWYRRKLVERGSGRLAEHR